MLRPRGNAVRRGENWRGIALIASTYVYFLIFAQFGFLKRLDQIGIAGEALKPVMAAMALGGILASLLAARMKAATAARRLRLALGGCAAAAALSLLPLHSAGFLAVSLLIGLSLGGLTVTLVAHLRLWLAGGRALLGVGAGAGIGYFVCNIPQIFAAPPQRIALVALGACACGLAASLQTEEAAEAPVQLPERKAAPFSLVLAWFTALVWLDSAAFFIIQNSPALKSGTWEGAAHLWRTGAVHLAAALGSAWLLARRGTSQVLALAFACLAAGCLLLLDPARSAPAAVLYPAGVSLYSVALVAFPSLLMPSVTQEQRSRRAGWIYAVAGWVGSALGIGMAQHLHRIPPWFVGAAALVFFLPWVLRYGRVYWREGAAIGVVLIAALAIEHMLGDDPAAPRAAESGAAAKLAAMARGRRVYIAEGCINCHSQYVRPHSPDVQMWGPAGNPEAIRREDPPLIGNRRQGPDLSQVGARRSPLWLKIHLIDPRAVSYGSIMPSYAYLFRDGRGDDLVAYLASLKSPDSLSEILKQAAAWQPPPAALAQAGQLNGAKLFSEDCATCHDSHGYARTRWGADFSRLPPDLATARFRHIPRNQSTAERRASLARIIKFGLAETDMPGHEYLPSDQIEALASEVMAMRQGR